MKLDFSIIKKHPYITGGVVIVVGIVVYMAASGGGSSSASASSSDNAAADQLALQQDSEQFQLAALATQNSGQYEQSVLAYNLGVDQLNESQATTAATLAAQTKINVDQITSSTELGLSQLATEYNINQNNNATALAQQQALSTEQEYAIASQSELQGLISNNQTLVANNQTQAAVQIAGINAGEQEYIAGHTGGNSTGGILGALTPLALIGALF